MLSSQQKIILLIVSLALFMESLDTNIINTAIPSMALSLNVNPIDLKIALISYLVSLAIFIPISGWVADKFGIKLIFILALFVFVSSSLWCGFATTLPDLVVGRILQGLGGSLMIPVGRLILLTNFKRHQYIDNMSRVVIVAAMGLMLGPVLGGFITHYLSWHWIFWMNIPVGLATMLLAYNWLPFVAPKKVPPLDKVGFLLFGLALATFTFGFSALSESTMPLIYPFSIIFLSIVSLIAYFWHSKYIKNPIVKSSLFRLRTFRISIIGNLLCRLGFGGLPFLLPLLLQIGLHYPPQQSGLLLAPLALGVVSVKSLAIKVLRLFGYKRLLIMNTFLVAFSLWSFIYINETTSIFYIIFVTYLFGLLISLQYSGMNSLAYAEMKHEDLSAAISIVTTAQQLSQSFGVATVALLIELITYQHFILDTHVFHMTLFILGLITLISTFIFIKLKPGDGLNMIQAVTFNEEAEVIP